MLENVISVIVPVYNVSAYLDRCVTSIRNQTYDRLEILLIDDGSTDGSAEMCDTFARLDDRVHVFHKENGGSSSARNLGIEKAKGEFLAFVDSDDYIDYRMYERLMLAIYARDTEMIDYLKNEQIQIAQIGRDELTEDGKELPNICTPPKKQTWYPAEDFLKELLLHVGDCSFCTKLVRRSLFDRDNGKFRFPEGVLNEDFHLLVQMLCEINGIISIPDYGYHVIYRTGSNTRKEDIHQFSRVYRDNVDNADMAYELVQKHFNENEELEKIAMRFGLFQRLDYLLHIPIEQMNKENEYYQKVVEYIRTHLNEIQESKYLTKKNKTYLHLLAGVPKLVRQIHKGIRGI